MIMLAAPPRWLRVVSLLILLLPPAAWFFGLIDFAAAARYFGWGVAVSLYVLAVMFFVREHRKPERRKKRWALWGMLLEATVLLAMSFCRGLVNDVLFAGLLFLSIITMAWGMLGWAFFDADDPVPSSAPAPANPEAE